MASSINTVSNSGSNYVSGLISGMDTETLVKNLLAGTQSKIDKQSGLKQQLTWKQEMYRSIISQINTFHDKYFSYLNSDTNLMSNSLYKTMKGSSSSDLVKIKSVSNNAVNGMTIDSISKLATACTVKSGASVTGNAVAGTVDMDSFADGTEYSFSMTLDGVSRTITFQGGADADETLKNINQAVYRNFGSAVCLDIDRTDASNPKIKLVQWDETNNCPSNKPVDPSRRVVIEAVTGETATTEGLGFGSRYSNKLDYTTPLKNLNFATELQGDRFEFEINGVKITGLTGDSTISDVLSAINNSGAGVTVSYSSASDRFIMQSSITGDIANISMSQTYGNLLTTMFGVESSGAQSTLFSNDMKVTTAKGLEDVRNTLNSGMSAKLVFQVDGKDVTVTVPGRSGSSKYTKDQEVVDAINTQLNKVFGTDSVKLTVKESASDSSKTDIILSSADHQIGFTDENLKTGFAKDLGFRAGNNISGGGDRLADHGLSGAIQLKDSTGTVIGSFDTAGKTIDQLTAFLDRNMPGASVAFENGRINITGAPDVTISGVPEPGGDGSNPVAVLFGSDEVDFHSTGISADVTKGENAVLSVNGVTIERNTNAFEIDGITIELTGESTSSIDLTTSRDTDKIVNSLKSFVEDYNALIDDLNSRIGEAATYKSYAPLTDEQKKEMSDREIELWEEKAKEGLLRNDSNISSLLSTMRSALYSSVEGAGLSLYDIGIETSSSWKENGKLVLNESTLRSVLTTNADAVQKLFTDPEQGLGARMQSALKAAANVSSGSPGTMVQYAGTKDVLSTNNTLYNEMKSISSAISRLNTTYEKEKARYWKQFNSMEQALANLSTQSSWLTSQFSS